MQASCVFSTLSGRLAARDIECGVRSASCRRCVPIRPFSFPFPSRPSLLPRSWSVLTFSSPPLASDAPSAVSPSLSSLLFFRAALHAFLCPGHAASWHARLQYLCDARGEERRGVSD